jgi:hypothetical protein
MVAVRGALYAVEPNHGELDRITPDGQISRVIDVSASQGHVVPASIAYHGNFYVGNLGTFGPEHQPENVYKITPSGQIKTVAVGLSEVLGVAFDAQGRMYALESSTGGIAPIPGTGDVVCFNDDGTRTVIADQLTVPTAMTLGPDGNLYVSNFGFGAPPGLGQIVRIDLTNPLAGATPELPPSSADPLIPRADSRQEFSSANPLGAQDTLAGNLSVLTLLSISQWTTSGTRILKGTETSDVSSRGTYLAADGPATLTPIETLNGNIRQGQGTSEQFGARETPILATGLFVGNFNREFDPFVDLSGDENGRLPA